MMTKTVNNTTIKTTNNIEFNVSTTVFKGANVEEEIMMTVNIKNSHIDFDFTSMLGDEETFVHATTNNSGDINEMAKAFAELMNIFDEK